ncbi:MAG: MFS transporter, partial [Bacteroidales bacterium]|nr:MFS transporter [Bacteroidales bacterium]
LIAAGGVAGWFLVRHEKSESRPVLPVDLLAQPVLALSALAAFCGTLSSMALILFMPFRLQYGYGFSPAEIGGLMAAYAVASVMISPLAGVLSDRIAVPVLSTFGMVVATLGMGAVALLPEQPGQFDIAWRLWLCGAGFGFFFAPNARFLVGSAPLSRAAAAGSLFTTTRMLAMAAGATLVAALLAMGLGDGPAPAIIAGCLAVVAGCISATGLRRPRAKD